MGEATAPIDEYGAPAAPVQDTYPAASAAEPASDSYGAPVADVLPAPSSPVGDSYGAPTSDILPASSSAEVVAADSGYGAPAEEPPCNPGSLSGVISKFSKLCS